MLPSPLCNIKRDVRFNQDRSQSVRESVPNTTRFELLLAYVGSNATDCKNLKQCHYRYSNHVAAEKTQSCRIQKDDLTKNYQKSYQIELNILDKIKNIFDFQPVKQRMKKIEQ